MTLHFQREIGKLKEKLLTLSKLVEEHVQMAVDAVTKRSKELAQKVAESDARVDRMEIEVEEECLKILALHQPVAIDLRFIVAALKINNDLERIGDLAVHVAHRALELVNAGPRKEAEVPIDLEGMAVKVLAMLRKSIAALMNMDARAAREVCLADEQVDLLNRETFQKMREELMSGPGRLDALTMLFASRHLERIADHTTNIAEDIIYMIEGDIVRHRKLAPLSAQ